MRPLLIADHNSARAAGARRADFAPIPEMIYAAASFWFLLLFLGAWAVEHLWTGMVKPKAVAIALLPGTILAHLGRIVGLLLTGARITAAAPAEDENQDGPPANPRYEPRLPVFGPLAAGLLPMAAIAAAAWFVSEKAGTQVLASVPHDQLALRLPNGQEAFWDQIRAIITQAEGTWNAVLAADGPWWHIAIFAYLMSCFCIRLGPFHGNARGHVGAILAVGATLALAGTISAQPAEWIDEAWPLVSFGVGWTLLLLMFSLFVQAVSATVLTILKWQN